MQIYKKNKVAQNIPTPLFLSPVRIPIGRQFPALPRAAQGKAAAACPRLLKSQKEDWQRTQAADQSLSLP